LLFGPGLSFGRIEDEGLEGDKLQRTAYPGAKTVAAVKGDGLMPVVKATRLRAADEKVGQRVRAGNGELRDEEVRRRGGGIRSTLHGHEAIIGADGFLDQPFGAGEVVDG